MYRKNYTLRPGKYLQCARIYQGKIYVLMAVPDNISVFCEKTLEKLFEFPVRISTFFDIHKSLIYIPTIGGISKYSLNGVHKSTIECSFVCQYIVVNDDYIVFSHFSQMFGDTRITIMNHENFPLYTITSEDDIYPYFSVCFSEKVIYTGYSKYDFSGKLLEKNEDHENIVVVDDKTVRKESGKICMYHDKLGKITFHDKTLEKTYKSSRIVSRVTMSDDKQKILVTYRDTVEISVFYIENDDI